VKAAPVKAGKTNKINHMLTTDESGKSKTTFLDDTGFFDPLHK
jgi:hypothetical protein